MPPTESAAHHDWVEAELYPGEKVVWMGNPTPFRLLWLNGTLGVSAVLLVAAAALLIVPPFWLDGLFPARSGIHLSLWHAGSILLVLMAFAYLSYRYWLTKQIVYAVTERRALIIERNVFGDKDTRAYHVFRYITRRNRDRGGGDLIFDTATRLSRPGRHMKRYKIVTDIGFLGIENVGEVEDLLHETFIGTRVAKSL